MPTIPPQFVILTVAGLSKLAIIPLSWRYLNGSARVKGSEEPTADEWHGPWYFPISLDIDRNGKQTLTLYQGLNGPPRPLGLEWIEETAVFNTDQVAALAGVHRATVLRHVDAGKLHLARTRKKGTRKPSDRGTFWFFGKEIKRWTSRYEFKKGRPGPKVSRPRVDRHPLQKN